MVGSVIVAMGNGILSRVMTYFFQVLMWMYAILGYHAAMGKIRKIPRLYREKLLMIVGTSRSLIHHAEKYNQNLSLTTFCWIKREILKGII